MKTGDHKILAGLILASIHINLFHVMLLPPCIGFLILYIGILQKERQAGFFQMDVKEMRVYRAAGAALVLVTAFSSFLSMFWRRPGRNHLVADSVYAGICGALWTDGKLHRRFAQTFVSLRTVLWICYGNGSSTVWVRSQPDFAYRAVAALCVYDYSGLPVYGGCGCYRGEERGIKNKKP